MNCVCASAQTIGIAYYDVDHLYDTLPALFYNDTDYTPEGRRHWTTERYRRKVKQVAAVIDSMRLPVVALNSVESEAVVRDISSALKGDYIYLHRTLNALDGMDFALFYYGDLFLPDYDEAGRGYLYVEGEMRFPTPRRARHSPNARPARPRMERIGLLLVRDVPFSRWIVRNLREERPGVKLIVMGRTAAIDKALNGLDDATARAAQAGRGNLKARTGWQMRDRILADTALRTAGGDVFARRWLADRYTGYPVPTYERDTYRGGASYALPVFVYIHYRANALKLYGKNLHEYFITPACTFPFCRNTSF